MKNKHEQIQFSQEIEANQVKFKLIIAIEQNIELAIKEEIITAQHIEFEQRRN